MGHFTKTGRPSTVRRVLPEWLSLASQVGKQANAWSRRNDLTAYIGDDGGRGLAPALYDPTTSEIEVNTTEAFGQHTLPSAIGDFTLRDTWFDWPVAAGAVMHEAMHAAYTSDAMCRSFEHLDREADRWFDLLDEPRIEGYGVTNYPDNRVFLRACALGIVFKDADADIHALTRTAAAARFAVLALGRVDAGVLEKKDVKLISKKVKEIIPPTVLGQLRDLWIEFQGLSAVQIDRMFEVAREFDRIVREQSKANGETGQDEQTVREFMDALKGDKIRTEFDAADEVFGQRTAEKNKQDRAAKEQADRDQIVNKGQAQSTFGPSGESRSHSASTVSYSRDPSDAERALAKEIGLALRRAKYRDRVVTKRNRPHPPGRLNVGAAMQNTASRKSGQNPNAEPWRDTIRHHVEDPNLTAGLMSDISGSMKNTMEAMGVCIWAMNRAVQFVYGRLAAVYFGNDIFSVLKPGEHQQQVKVYTAPDRAADFDRAFRALDGGLNLLNGSGARLLVVNSDAEYTDIERTACVKWLQACRDKGVAVVWLDYKPGGKQITDLATETGMTVVPIGADATAAAAAIGAACIQALQKASR